MTNPTAQKFGYPRSLVAETASWLVLVRPSQPTLGALVLVCKEPAEAFSQLSPAAFADLAVVTRGVEQALSKLVGYARINYLMLMMVDRDVHFHVLPRYEGERTFEGFSFTDHGWPAAPKLTPAVDLEPPVAEALVERLRALWPAA
ncbi:MAG TPA: HIT family protein [Phenylobacterium sp.]|uniref:HIT family protein n=1 Tax=Phenylobacterium sp. TaxID=1871053 RepID=UPI002B47B53A|nr:HIT family protein [Phenylobacterium sp.]HKR89685.1 HIT family protein [Phenylobacterium sp.]